MNDRMKKLATLLVLATTVLAGPVFAQLRLTITSGVTDLFVGNALVRRAGRV